MSVVMLNAILLNVVMLKVLAPSTLLLKAGSAQQLLFLLISGKQKVLQH
jgi:hypothetical protein